MTTAELDLEARLVTNDGDGAWTYAVAPDSSATFGTRRPVKVEGTIDGHPIRVTLLPMGDGTHMVPVRSQVRTTIGKQAGATVHLALSRVAA